MSDSKSDDLPDPDVKIILLGDSAVGKVIIFFECMHHRSYRQSKLVERYLMDEYNPRQVLLVSKFNRLINV